MKPCACIHPGTCILSPTLQRLRFELVMRTVSSALIAFENTPNRSIWLKGEGRQMSLSKLAFCPRDTERQSWFDLLMLILRVLTIGGLG